MQNDANHDQPRSPGEIALLESLAKPSAIEAALKIQAALISASASGTTGVWTATVRLNCGGAIDIMVGCEQRIRICGGS